MTKVVIIINENGKYDTVYADSEVDVRILRRDEDEIEICEAEQCLEEIAP